MQNEIIALARKHGLRMGSATSVRKIEDLAATMPPLKETGVGPPHGAEAASGR